VKKNRSLYQSSDLIDIDSESLLDGTAVDVDEWLEGAQ
jgi:hypothetical protein